MINEYDHVLILEKNIKGIVVDYNKGDNFCIVEDDEQNKDGDYDLYHCSLDELELLNHGPFV